MYRILLLGIFLHLGASVASQVIAGKVLDAETQEPVSFASVFFDGTFVGTSSDEQGNFKLDVGRYISRPLTISAIGYYPYALEGIIPGKKYVILLQGDVYKIDEVQVTGKVIAKKRKKYLGIFRREFLGATHNARRCYIMNEEDISFDYQSDKDTLRAYAQKPLEIQNEALGYYFTYHLKNFEYLKATRRVSYEGSIVFTHDLAREGDRSGVYERRRNYAYTGSSKEFIRQIWNNSLKSSGYSVRDYRTRQMLTYKDVVHEDDQGRKYLKYPGDLEILYYYSSSWIRFLKPEAFIDWDGFFDPGAILWGGQMAIPRIADFLPYEYSVGR